MQPPKQEDSNNDPVSQPVPYGQDIDMQAEYKKAEELFSQQAFPTKTCPICQGEATVFDGRRPNTVCESCQSKAVDKNGDQVRYSNEGASGGLVTIHIKPDGSRTEDFDFDCTIEGRACQGVELYMGGTAVEVVQ
jgi:hypothetical protein